LADFKSNSKGNGAPNLSNAPLPSLNLEGSEDLEKLRSDLVALAASTDKQIKGLEGRLDFKTDKSDLEGLERRLMEILEMQINNL